ncbi:MAG: hypothetical protein ACKO3F_10140 [Cyanobium sp.]
MPADPLPVRPETLKPLLLQVPEDGYGNLYRQHLFDQYRLAMEMADRLSARRMQANTFFLAVNTGLLTVLANLVKDRIISGIAGALPLTRVETWVPRLFALLYLLLLLAVLLGGQGQVAGGGTP